MKPIDKVLTIIYHDVTVPAGNWSAQDGNRKTKCEIGLKCFCLPGQGEGGERINPMVF